MRNARVRTQRGLTLLEIMVSITVGLILLSGVVSIFISNKTGYRLQESASVLDENSRFALNQMQYDLRMGDHWGGIERGAITVDPALTAPVGTPCALTNAVSAVGFVAFEGAASSPLADCIPNADYQPNTDILVIHYAEPDRISSAFAAGDGGKQLYLRTAIGRRGFIFKGSAIATLPSDMYDSTNKDPPEMANYHYRTVIYFVRKCASQDRGTVGVCDAADDSTPTLCRLVLSDTVMVQEDVVAAVEQMQVTFGSLFLDSLVNGQPTIRYDDATTITANNKWDRVVNLQVSLVMRGTEFDVAYIDPASGDASKAYVLPGANGGFKYQPADKDKHFRRKRYDFAVQIRNMTRA